MKFKEFLKEHRKTRGFTTVKDHYESLGGLKKLDTSLRNFQLMASGARQPTEKLLAKLFALSLPEEKKTLVVSFFESNLSNSNEAGELLSYIEQYLSPAIATESKSVWETSRSHMLLSQEQINFFLENPEALKLHLRLVMFDEEPKGRSSIESKSLTRMEKLGLIKITNNMINPSKELFQIPTFENSGPKLTAKGTDLILKMLDIYLSHEGNSRQAIDLQMQLVSKEMASKIILQMKSFKKWIQSLNVSKHPSGTETVPFLFACFGKELEERDL